MKWGILKRCSSRGPRSMPWLVRGQHTHNIPSQTDLRPVQMRMAFAAAAAASSSARPVPPRATAEHVIHACHPPCLHTERAGRASGHALQLTFPVSASAVTTLLRRLAALHCGPPLHHAACYPAAKCSAASSLTLAPHVTCQHVSCGTYHLRLMGMA